VFLAVGDGFVQVTADRVAILTDMAIRAENIDEARAEEARLRAEARLAEKITDAEAAHIQAALVACRGPAQGQTPAAEINRKLKGRTGESPLESLLICASIEKAEEGRRSPRPSGYFNDFRVRASVLEMT